MQKSGIRQDKGDFKKNFQTELKKVDYQMNSVMRNYTSKKTKCKKF